MQQCGERAAGGCLTLGVQVELTCGVSLGINPEAVAKAFERCNVQFGCNDRVASARKRTRHAERGGGPGDTFSERELANVEVF